MSSLRMLLFVGAGALLVAIAPWPYPEYYKLLRFFICGLCTFGAYVSLRERSPLFAAGFLVAGVMFNPIAKVQMEREVWIAADLLVASFMIVVARLAPRLDAARPTGMPIATQTVEAQPVELTP